MNQSTKYGLITAAALIIYFIILDVLGMGSQVYLLFFNAIIASVGVFLTIRGVYDIQEEHFNYMEGFMSGIKMGFIATTIYTVFVAIYIFEINQDLTQELRSQIEIAGTGIEAAIILFIFLSGIATAIVASLVVIPLYKRTWNTRRVRAQQDPLNGKQQ
ncbi:MAG: DUF4199 domain-containing protein [Nonlabens sp.]